jgi:hypothetical protein
LSRYKKWWQTISFIHHAWRQKETKDKRGKKKKLKKYTRRRLTGTDDEMAIGSYHHSAKRKERKSTNWMKKEDE